MAELNVTKNRRHFAPFIIKIFQAKAYFRPKSAGISPHSSVFHLRIVVV